MAIDVRGAHECLADDHALASKLVGPHAPTQHVDIAIGRHADGVEREIRSILDRRAIVASQQGRNRGVFDALIFDFGREHGRQAEGRQIATHRRHADFVTKRLVRQNGRALLKSVIPLRHHTQPDLAPVSFEGIGELRVGLRGFAIGMGTVEHDLLDPGLDQAVDQFAFVLSGGERDAKLVQGGIVDRDHDDVLRHRAHPQLRAGQPQRVFGGQRQIDRGRNQPEQDRENRHLQPLAAHQVLARLERLVLARVRLVHGWAAAIAAQQCRQGWQSSNHRARQVRSGETGQCLGQNG